MTYVLFLEIIYQSIYLFQRYEALKFNVNSFFDLIKEPILKKLIMAKHTNVLLAGLCQLSLLPIAKPNSEMAVESDIDELKYEQLIEDQITFKNILKELILTDRNPLVIREMIFLLSHKVMYKLQSEDKYIFRQFLGN